MQDGCGMHGMVSWGNLSDFLIETLGSRIFMRLVVIAQKDLQQKH